MYVSLVITNKINTEQSEFVQLYTHITSSLVAKGAWNQTTSHPLLSISILLPNLLTYQHDQAYLTLSLTIQVYTEQ